ncbi:acyl-CoA dehydratase activase [Heliomicrobium gestii]|uniref:acyl-CoA dehydratase activase n=1 Tax=Heliomicrobium gestii TaxID=2699 RepID=UPI0022A7EC04|nr:acyl-CoA dehydratase activase [Heliomicrobium gestii]MBM7868204.1 putative CoA-substrate-specific enzyme activase [Heliomicrobium gestii]
MESKGAAATPACAPAPNQKAPDGATIVAGIDAGSTAVKLVLDDGNRRSVWQRPSGWSPGETARELLQEALAAWGRKREDVAHICGTGYGRVNLPFLDSAVTEIACHARGAVHLRPGAQLVIDIGGQDAKGILVGATGRVLDFVMNDKCAAGTGRFLAVMAHALGMEVAEMGALVPGEGLPMAGIHPHPINAMCTVFAESEVIGLLNQGVDRRAIIAGLHQSVARRVAAMVARLGASGPVLFTGGVARNAGVGAALEKELGCPVEVNEQSPFAGAIGAVLIAREKAAG